MINTINFNEVSQQISMLNAHTKKYNKFNHTWDQILFDFSRPESKSRAVRILRDISEQVLSISGNQNSPNNIFFTRIIDANQSKVSKRSSSTILSIKSPLKSQMMHSKNNSDLRQNLEEIDQKVKTQPIRNVSEVLPKIKKTFDREMINEMFSLKGVLSKTTEFKIKDLEEKVRRMKTHLESEPEIEKIVPLRADGKGKRPLGKIRATHFGFERKPIKKTTIKSMSLKHKRT